LKSSSFTEISFRRSSIANSKSAISTKFAPALAPYFFPFLPPEPVFASVSAIVFLGTPRFYVIAFFFFSSY
jgi:hypothetical protein